MSFPRNNARRWRRPRKCPIVYTNVVLKNWTAFQKAGVNSIYAPGSYFEAVQLDLPVSMGDYKCPRTPDEPIVVHMMKTPCHPGLPARDQHRAGRVELYGTTFETFERNIRDQLARALASGGFDPARDIAAITVNRWPHGYAYEYNSLFDPFWLDGGEQPCVVARQPFGRVAIANADAAAYSYTDAAIDEAYRAVDDLLGIAQRLEIFERHVRLGKHLSSIHDNSLPSNKSRLVAGQKQSSVRNVLHRAEPPLRNRRCHPRNVLRAERFHPLGQNVSRKHGVHGDVVRRQFDGRGANETELSCLARRVMAPAGISGDRSGDRRSNDNAPLAPRLQFRQTRIHRKKRAFEIDIENLIPIRDAHRSEPRSRKHTGVATDDVDAAMAFHRGPRHSCAVFFTRNIGGHGAGASAERISAAAASACARSRAASNTLAPLLAKTRAIPLPIPLLAPVTITERPASDVSTIRLF